MLSAATGTTASSCRGALRSSNRRLSVVSRAANNAGSNNAGSNAPGQKPDEGYGPKIKEASAILQKYMARVGKAHAGIRADLMEKRRVMEQERVINMRDFQKSFDDVKQVEVRFLSNLLDAIIPTESSESSTPGGGDSSTSSSNTNLSDI